ncbi:MAG: MBL fold metallo-hydrolase [Acidobacteria bacterium]|nr:MBL fold metallo-hydrolase [Acidobacteriota bacterium]
MKLTVLGCGTVSLTPDQACAGYHLTAGRHRLLMDCGGGVLLRLMQAELDYMDVDGLLLSHVRHPDHVSDVPLLLFAWNYRVGGPREAPLLVVGPPGTKEFIEAVHDLFPATNPKSYQLIIREMFAGDVPLPGARLRVRPMRHGRVPAVGFRLDERGRSMAYSGDTAYCPALVELCRDVDLALLDCSFPAGRAVYDSHLTAREVGRVAAESGAAAVMITHRYPVGSDAEVDNQIRETYNGPLHLARDLMSITVGPATGRPEVHGEDR